jgi:hypothetical protein
MKKTGLVNNKAINFRWNEKGFRKIASRAKKLKMSKEAYLRHCVDHENSCNVTCYP